MFDEREYLRKLEIASAEQLAEMVLTGSIPEERILNIYFGSDRYERIRQHASGYRARMAAGAQGHGTVFILPGILGSELWEEKKELWLQVWNLFRGKFDQLPLDPGGISIQNISPPNVLQNYYGEMQQALLHAGWNPVVFPFDWRLDIAATARLLKARIDAADPIQPLRFVAHSMGGLVVRSLLSQYPDTANRLERFIMMGTPNYGSFAIPILYSGLNSILKFVDVIDLRHNMDELLAIAKTFLGTYQMQPFLGASPDAARLFDPATYGNLNPPQARFDAAKLFQAAVTQALPLDPNRCVYVAGYNEFTPCGIKDWNRLTSMRGYQMTPDGDGTVPHSLGLLPNLTTYYVHAKHSDLPANKQVIGAVKDILAHGSTTALPTQRPVAKLITSEAMQSERQQEQTELEARVADLRDQVIARHSIAPDEVSSAELELRNILFTGRKVTDWH